jgi:hypothetical protein
MNEHAADRFDVFAFASQSFFDSFGHPADSPWHGMPLDGLSGHQANDLIETLGGIEKTANALLDRIAANAQIGIASLDDLQTIVVVDAKLGHPSDSELIGIIAPLDEQELSCALRLKRDLQEVESDLAHYPDLGEQDPSTFADALKIVDLKLPDALLRNVPDRDAHDKSEHGL